jgi:hypothetical protein
MAVCRLAHDVRSHACARSAAQHAASDVRPERHASVGRQLGGCGEGAVRACLWESVGRIADKKTKELLAALLSYPDVKSEWKNPIPLGFMPVIPLSFVKHDRLLNYFSVLTTVGTPQTVAAQERRIEGPFSADEATETLHVALISAA